MGLAGTYILNCDIEFFETLTPSWSQAKLYTLINKERETLCVGWEECVNQNEEYGPLLTLPTKSTFLPLTTHIPLSCALISPSLPLLLLLSPISTPPTVNKVRPG